MTHVRPLSLCAHDPRRGDPLLVVGLVCSVALGCGSGADVAASRPTPEAAATTPKAPPGPGETDEARKADAAKVAAAADTASKPAQVDAAADTASKPATPPAPASPDPAVVAPSGPLRAQTPGAYRPCEITVQSCTKDGKPCAADESCYVSLARVIPEGEPIDVNIEASVSLRWRYAADERVLESPGYIYKHTGANKGSRARRDGSDKQAVEFDAQGRLTRIGRDIRIDYTPDGRAAGRSYGKGNKWKQVVTYTWGPKETLGIGWTYPDSDEFCEPVPEKVELDAQGRVVREVFADCQINYSEFTLHYHYDAAGRPDALDVECAGDPKPDIWRLALKYEC